MSQDLLADRAHTPGRHAARAHAEPASPGRRTLSGSLPASSGTSAILRAAARPEHRPGATARDLFAPPPPGVRPDAEASVERAASSSGSPLPAALQRKFEGSLGASLDGVRVHTGEASATAATAVNARAFATGQDIHFAAGQYDPTSHAGEHLLAHEVAHTVQQRGGAAHGAQHKLEVSSPGDALEHEADRAADAMVAGQRASVSGGHAQLSRDPAPFPLLEPPGPRPAPLPGGIDPSDPQLKKLLDGGGKGVVPLGGGDPQQLDVGITPDPLDPFEQPATNWDAQATPLAGPDVPLAWIGISYPPRSPLPRLRFDGKPCSRVTPSQTEAAHQALAAFEQVHVAVNTSWNAMIPGITSYTEASKDLSGTGLLGTEGGLGWNTGDPGADLSKLTGQQKVGPDGKQTIEDVFKNKDGSAGTDSHADAAGAHGTKKSKEALNAAKRASNEVRTSVSEHKIAQAATKGTAEGVRAAILLVEINEAKVEADKLQEEKEQLEKDKAQAEEKLEAVVSSLEAGTLIGFGAADAMSGGFAHGAESIMIGLEIGAEVVGKAIINAKYDDKIEAADRQLKAALAGIRSKQGRYVQAALNSAIIAHDAAMARVRTTRETMLAKVAAYQSAYDAFAAEAGKAAGGGAKGAQVQAALESIPRIEQCLGQLAQIQMSAALPTYSEASGRGFNGFGKPADFLAHLGQLKGYRAKFSSMEKLWKARLMSVKALEKQLGT